MAETRPDFLIRRNRKKSAPKIRAEIAIESLFLQKLFDLFLALFQLVLLLLVNF